MPSPPKPLGAEHEGRSHATPITNAASPKNGQVTDRIHHLGNERHGANGGVMAPTVMALGYDEIDARAFYLHRVLHLAHHGADLGAVGLEPIHPGSGIAKARHVNGHLLLNNHFHLGFKKLCGQGQGLIRISGDLKAFRIRGLKAEFIHKLLGKTLERRYLLRRGRALHRPAVDPGPGGRTQAAACPRQRAYR